MKFAILLAFLSLTTVFNAAHATEEMTSGNIDVPVYCEEQAQLAGIEEADEKNQYIQECVDSFGMPAADDESAQQDQ